MIKIYKYGEVSNDEIFARVEPKINVEQTVSDIIENVKKFGDFALCDYTKKFDGVCIQNLQVTEEEIEKAFNSVDEEFINILKKAAENIKTFHEKQKRDGFKIENPDGTIMGQKIIPVDRAGLYVPGGTAAYPSTVLMDSIPAKIAGVAELIMVTPPDRQGKINPVILAAAKLAGVDKILK